MLSSYAPSSYSVPHTQHTQSGQAQCSKVHTHTGVGRSSAKRAGAEQLHDIVAHDGVCCNWWRLKMITQATGWQQSTTLSLPAICCSTWCLWSHLRCDPARVCDACDLDCLFAALQALGETKVPDLHLRQGSVNSRGVHTRRQHASAAVRQSASQQQHSTRHMLLCIQCTWSCAALAKAPVSLMVR